MNEDVVPHGPKDLEALLSRILELEHERDEARAWAWSQWHRYFDPTVTDRHHPPAWLESDDVPVAWAAADEARRQEMLATRAPEDGYQAGAS